MDALSNRPATAIGITAITALFVVGFWPRPGGSGCSVTTNVVSYQTPTTHQGKDLTGAEGDGKLEEWLRTFKAANPKYQAWCVERMEDKVVPISGDEGDKGSQFGQDMFTFHNFFKGMALAGEKGFYIESGANDATYLSNSLFYDVCLGWEGLCIEPQVQYHSKLKAERSCTLVPECISEREETVMMTQDGVASEAVSVAAGGRHNGKKTVAVQCAPLHTLMERYASADRAITLWSLDVEGFEMAVLASVDFEKSNIGALLIEDFWLSQREIDYLLASRGYNKVQQMAIDSLWMPRSTTLMNGLWYSGAWDAYWKGARRQSYRCAHDAKKGTETVFC